MCVQCQLLLGKRTQRHGRLVDVDTRCRKSLYATQTVRIQVYVTIGKMQLTDGGHAASDTGGLLLSIQHIAGCSPCSIVQLCQPDTYPALTSTKSCQFVSQSSTQPTKHPTNQPSSQPTNQPVNWSVSQSINQSLNQSNKQPPNTEL